MTIRDTCRVRELHTHNCVEMLIQSLVGERPWSEGRAASEGLQPTLAALPDDVWYSIVCQIVAHLGTAAALSVRALPSPRSPPSI